MQKSDLVRSDLEEKSGWGRHIAATIESGASAVPDDEGNMETLPAWTPLNIEMKIK